MGVDLDKWTEKVQRCEYLAEDELKALCEYVSVMLALCFECLSQTEFAPGDYGAVSSKSLFRTCR